MDPLFGKEQKVPSKGASLVNHQEDFWIREVSFDDAGVALRHCGRPEGRCYGRGAIGPIDKLVLRCGSGVRIPTQNRREQPI